MLKFSKYDENFYLKSIYLIFVVFAIIFCLYILFFISLLNGIIISAGFVIFLVYVYQAGLHYERNKA